MKKRRSALIQLAILTALGAAVALTLLLPQMSGLHRRPQPLELSVIIREQDSSFWTNTRMGMEQAAGELGAELRFLTLATANDGREPVGAVTAGDRAGRGRSGGRPRGPGGAGEKPGGVGQGRSGGHIGIPAGGG